MPPELIQVSSYISVVGMHTTLWAFTALCLPRTSFLFTITTPAWDPVQLSSRDHPQHPFFEPLTLNPTHTLAWFVVGAAFLQSWWAGWLRQWWSDTEKGIDRVHYQRQKLHVCLNSRFVLNGTFIRVVDIQQAFKDAWLMTMGFSVAAHILLILFGAPIAR